MNHKKLLIAALATAISGIAFASEEVAILPYPYPIQETIDYSKLSPQDLLKECKKHGIKTPEYKELKGLVKDAQEIIEQTGTVDLTPEGLARRQASIAAIVNQIQERNKVFAEKINEATAQVTETNILQDAAAKAEETTHHLAAELGKVGDK